MDDNVLVNLHLVMVDSILPSVVEKKTMKENWDTLIKLYEFKSLHTKIFFKGKIYTLQMSESMMITNHIKNLNTLFAQLIGSYFNTVENEHVELLLQSIPDSYDQLIIDITNNFIGCLSFDDVVGAILEEKSR
uniref:Retrovirus-related Pol polyprotein from transposon TNT 1-94 n=1 Tax=Cajanus cajan TaxID=3821 RepID=A0A151TFL3_CAJCA|nr:Retrovirus-related Pol polyprotein from transposon TNT 1-94 [Cajanus cajan]